MKTQFLDNVGSEFDQIENDAAANLMKSKMTLQRI